MRGETPRAGALAAGALAALLLALNHDLLSGRAVPHWDADRGFAPWYILVADYARAGRLLRWNPWTAGGSPDFADPQLGAFSPLTVGLGLVTGGTLGGFWAYWLLTWLAGGVGALLLARRLGAPPWGAFAAACGFTFSGYLTGHGSHTSFVHAFAALPWIAWRIEAAAATGARRPWVEAGALWGLSALAGYPGQVAANAGLAVLWAAGRALFPARPDGGAARRAARAGVGLAAFFAVGAAVLSPVYVSLLRESAGVTVRAGPLPRASAVGSNAMHPEALATFASPYLSLLKLGNLDSYWPYTDVTSASIYLGAPALWLAGLALLARPRDGWRWWLAGCAVVGLLLAMGQALPFRGWLYDLLPPARYVRHASLFNGYLPLAAAALAALGARDLAEGRVGRRRMAGLALAGGAAAVGVAWGMLAAARQAGLTILGGLPLDPWLAVGPPALVWSGLLAVTAMGRRPGPPTRALMIGLPLLAVVDAVAAHRLARPILHVQGEPYAGAWRALQAGKVDALVVPWERAVSSPLGAGNHSLLTKQSVLASWAPLYNPFHDGWMREPALVASAVGHDRVYCAERAAESHLSFDALRALVRRTHALGAPPLVLHSPAAMRAGLQPAAEPGLEERLAALPAAARAAPSVARYEPDALALSVTCPAAGWLWVTERYGRSWRARVNGREVPVWGANFLFRAVPVEAGVSEVVFTYAPAGIPGLVVLSWAALALVAAWAVRAQRQRPGGVDPGTGRSPGAPSGNTISA